MTSPYRYVQAFSIDIASGGVIGALFVAKYLGETLSTFIAVVLFLAIWLIYTFDHLMDAGAGSERMVTLRHKIHQKYSTTIWGFWSFVLVIMFSLLFQIPDYALIAGGMLAVLVLIYFISLKFLDDSKVYHKEISAAFIYATGIFVGPLSTYTGDIGIDFWLLYLEFILLALINMLVLSMYEQIVDQRSGFHSLVKSIGLQKARLLTNILIFVVMAISIVVMFNYMMVPAVFYAQLTVFIMVFVLALVQLFQKKLILNERFRAIADAVFFIPLVYIL